MFRRRLALLPVVGLLLTGCLRLEAPTAEEPSGEPDSALIEVSTGEAAATATLEPSCPPADPSEPLTADDLNEAMDEADLRYWQSADVGASAVLADGRVLWVWGDTIRKLGVQPRMVDNSILVTSGTCISQLVTEPKGPVLPPDPNGLSVWPMSVIRMEPGPEAAADVTDVVVVYCTRVQRGDRMWDFIVRGITVAVYEVGADGVPRLADAAQLTPDDPDLGAIHWGAASVLDGDWVYLYGTRNTGEAFVYGHELYVARVPATDPTSGAAMEYWDGATWQDDRGRAAPLIGAVEGVSQMLSVDVVDGRFLAYSKLGGDPNDWAAIWTADGPAGPFGPGRPVLESPSGLDEGYLQYTPLAHPDIPTTPGNLLVSVSRNVSDYDLLLRRPDLGRPLFAEIPRGPGT
ncbi:DUF4185 domain-containing protein [Trujillonella endophytica]|uniref:DUF4185 domain-containing protein n=1 Tax=Trujillonella endophytica TaxID=673521 RepID=UPI001114439D|nr:DUF4185 domain-containing protein [Trujillella endophytica]